MNQSTTLHLWRTAQVVTWVVMIVVVVLGFHAVRVDADRHERQDRLEQQQTCEFRRNLVNTIEASAELEIDPATITNDPSLQAYAVQKQINRAAYIAGIDQALNSTEGCD